MDADGIRRLHPEHGNVKTCTTCILLARIAELEAELGEGE